VKGGNPFDYVTLNSTSAKLSTIVRVYDRPSANACLVLFHQPNAAILGRTVSEGLVSVPMKIGFSSPCTL
jgi:hypothetical protein